MTETNRRPVKGYEGLYEVNEDGQVYSVRKHRLLKPSVTNSLPYPRVNLFKDKTIKHCYVHRLVAETFLAKPEEKSEVNHKDGNKINNSIENLEWVTHAENVRHAFQIGLNQAAFKLQGENASSSKLTDSNVLKIRKLYKPYLYSMKRLAREYGVSTQNIYVIISGGSWKHLL